MPDQFITISSNLSISDEQTMNDTYKLPDIVLRSGIRSQNASIPITYTYYSRFSSSKWYFYLHFVEIEKLEQAKQRKMVVDFNSEYNETVKLEYLKPVTIRSPFLLTGPTINFTVSTEVSSGLPPVLNGFQLIKVRNNSIYSSH